MRRIIILTVTMVSILTGCSKEKQQEQCLVGTWSNTGVCQSATTHTFNSNNSGITYQDNCSNTCVNNSEWRVRIDFDYQVSNDQMTMTYNHVYSCDSLISGQSTQPVTFNFSCSGNTLVLGAQTYTKQ